MLDRYEDDDTDAPWWRRAARRAREGLRPAEHRPPALPPRPAGAARPAMATGDETGPQGWRRWLPALVIAAALAVTALLVLTRPQTVSAPPAERVWTVEAVPVAVSDARPRLRVFGEVVPARKVELRALVAGEIIETGPGLREGAVVAAGDLLAVIDPFDYRAAVDEAQAQLKEARARLDEIRARVRLEREALANARAQLAIRKRDLERALRLAASGNISQKTVDDRRLAVAQQEAAVDQRESNLAVETARIAQQQAAIARLEIGLKRAERDLANTRITAPFAGFIGNVAAERGKRVGLNERLADLTDAQDMDARFTLSNAQYGRIVAREGSVIGRDAQVRWQVGGRMLAFPARVDRIGAQIAADAGGISVFARLAPLDPDTPLRPGAFVEVELPDAVYEDVVRLPETALYDGHTVYVIADGRLAPRLVEVAARDGADILVSGDLRPGERVMITRFPEAGPGVRVEVRENPSGPAGAPEQPA